jgi:hypothetical protein
MPLSRQGRWQQLIAPVKSSSYVLNIEIAHAAYAAVRHKSNSEYSVDLPDAVVIVYSNIFADTWRDTERVSTKASITTVTLLFYDDILYVAWTVHCVPRKIGPLSRAS